MKLTVTDNNLHDEQNSEFFQSAAKKKEFSHILQISG